MNKNYKDLLAAAHAVIETVPTDKAMGMLKDDNIVFVDLRDRRELEREGRIPGAFHCPRGMLEFWIDPESPYHKDIFAQGKTYLFYCASAWRSALATQTAQDMGLTPVAHIAGGFSAWKLNGGPVEDVSAK
ncbi:rhodanese-like domain-containing protein [Actibacterium atlanticum]|uniref:Rhodanese-like domain-containing protein n=1 Tax=Actibacterium atlanticum TaxID=1461693 RepID=A0A058ZPD6_9RHOB|nr:rhodanese-like domain-containing protein [Actibacterium atlanticum]KCV83027.1 rhodanese-like domain-containing protein [Actibacterium atlanticum]